MTEARGFDEVLALAKRNEATNGEVLVAFLTQSFLVPSPADFDAKKPFEPLTLTAGGVSNMVVFTGFEHMKMFESMSKSAGTFSGRDVFLAIQDPALGILVNPGTESGYQIDGPAAAKLAEYVRSVDQAGQAN